MFWPSASRNLTQWRAGSTSHMHSKRKKGTSGVEQESKDRVKTQKGKRESLVERVPDGHSTATTFVRYTVNDANRHKKSKGSEVLDEEDIASTSILAGAKKSRVHHVPLDDSSMVVTDKFLSTAPVLEQLLGLALVVLDMFVSDSTSVISESSNTSSNSHHQKNLERTCSIPWATDKAATLSRSGRLSRENGEP
ncbi:hypothetical protein BGY98DRAFT_954220 [Russula aff. rugulosa BPL654]|nr:hypothetical protein BGY98DRAFT_954220 [Russula aff. rugulosa BPL654]